MQRWRFAHLQSTHINADINAEIKEIIMFTNQHCFQNHSAALAALAALATGACLLAGSAQAAGISNGDFATGNLSGWASSGNAAVDSTASFGAPAPGMTAQAVMGSAASSGFLFGGSAVSAATLEAFTGLGAGTLTAMGGVVGSAISQSFTSGAGDSLSFSWKFMSDEPVASPANDTAFIVLDGVFKLLTSVQTAAFTGSSLSPMLDETAYASYSTTLTAGAHTLAFGVMDVPDTLGASALAISGVSVAAVPEPQTWALMLAGAAALGSLVRRRQQVG
jgi:hypothetical protein